MPPVLRKLLVVAWNTVVVRASDGGLILMAVAAPLCVSVLVNLALGDIVMGRGVPEARLAIAVANEDRGSRWGNLGRAFEQVLLPGPDSPEPYARLFAARGIGDGSEALQQVRDGRLVAAVAIPPDFSEALATESADIQVYVNGREEILGRAFGSAIETYAGLISAGEVAIRITVESLASDPRTRALLEAGEFDDELADMAIRAARPETNPSQVTSAMPPERGAGVRLTYYFAAAIAVTLVSLSTLMTGASLFQEKAYGTLQRAYVSPTAPATILWGKVLGSLLGGLMLLAVLILGMAAVERLLSGEAQASSVDVPGLALLAVATVTAASGFGIVLTGLCRTYGQVATYGRALVILMGLVGGVFLPVSILPAPLSLLSRLTLQYWAMDGFLTLARGKQLQDILPQVIVLAAMGVICMIGGSRLLLHRATAGG